MELTAIDRCIYDHITICVQHTKDPAATDAQLFSNGVIEHRIA